MPLTQDQLKGESAFFDFLMSNEREFILSGGAGVGKTYLMGHLCNKILPEYQASCKLLGIPAEYHAVEFTAMTNKAAEVLEKAIKREVTTIHSFLGLKVQEDWKTGKTDLVITGGTKAHTGKIVFIDESSMLDSQLHAFIRELLKDCKIVYVGDHAQLAPVNEDVSPIYGNVDPANFIHLTQPIRNADSQPLMDLCAQFRHAVETEEFSPIIEVPGVIDFLDDDQMEAELTRHFQHQNDGARILCYTNERVNLYNAFIRQVRQLPEHYMVGEQLVVATAYQRGNVSLSVERQVEVMKSSHIVLETSFAKNVKIPYRQMTVQDTRGRTLDVNVAANSAILTQSLKQLSKAKDWSSYFSLKAFCADLRPKDACTVYKSQGSTYDTVFVDLGNIGTCRDAAQAARMLFVAFSRPTTRLYLYGKLPAAYQGRSTTCHKLKLVS